MPPKGGRLLLASDGAYEPHEEAGHDLYALLSEDSPQPNLVVARFVQAAVKTARKQLPDDRHHIVDNATALLADLTR